MHISNIGFAVPFSSSFSIQKLCVHLCVLLCVRCAVDQLIGLFCHFSIEISFCCFRCWRRWLSCVCININICFYICESVCMCNICVCVLVWCLCVNVCLHVPVLFSSKWQHAANHSVYGRNSNRSESLNWAPKQLYSVHDRTQLHFPWKKKHVIAFYTVTDRPFVLSFFLLHLDIVTQRFLDSCAFGYKLELRTKW